MKPMIRRLALMAALAFGALWAGAASAVPPGLSLEFEGGGMGKVIFSGSVHSHTHCSTCHMDLFHVSRSSEIRQEDHRSNRYCYACHDGEKAFGARRGRDCANCHKMD
jgi:c(7)-type cytochrome triheme protein